VRNELVREVGAKSGNKKLQRQERYGHAKWWERRKKEVFFFHLAEALELCILEGEGMYVKEVCYAFLQLTLLLL